MGLDKEDILRIGLVIGVCAVTTGVISYGGLKLVGKFTSNRGNIDLNKSFNIFKVTAALELPPASPADEGIFLSILITTPGFSIPVYSKKALAALNAIFFSPSGILSLLQNISVILLLTGGVK